MYPAPPNIATTVFARIPDKFRIHGRSNRWIDVQRGGAATDCFLEDPSSWKPQVTACKHQENRMDIDFPSSMTITVWVTALCARLHRA